MLFRSSKGKKLPPLSEEHKRKISEANKGQTSWLKGKKRLYYSPGMLGKHCSEEHKAILRKVHFKTGRIKTQYGYILVYQPNHPNPNWHSPGSKVSYVYEHRLVMEKYLGRHLEKWEWVHHRNGIKDDNRIENLEIVFKKPHYGQVRCPYCQKEFLIQ